jgi:hypothetical protein
MDVKITYGSNIRWIKAGDKVNITDMTVTGTLTVGEDAAGFDFSLFSSDTSGDGLTWDASEEVLQITGKDANTALDVLDGDVRIVDKLYFYDRGGEYLSSDGSTLTITGAVTIGALSLSSRASNWTNASRTVADMGIVTTIDINGGTIDAAIIGGASAAAITGTTVTGTSLVGGTVAGTTGTFSGVVDVTDTTDSSDATGDTGALRTEGGASIAKKLYVGTDLSVGNDLTIAGDLNVDGTTTTVDSTTVAVGDSMILLAKDQGTSADAVDFGIYGKYGVGGTAKYAGIFRDLSATGDPWTFFDTLEAEPGTTVNTSGTGYDLADISAGAITSADGFTGDLTGNVTGNTSGTAATVTTAAQSNITSLGTLTTLTVDNVIVNGTTIGHTSDTDLLTLTSANLAVAGDIEVSGEVQTANIGYTDGDNSMTIADGGKVTFAAGFAVGSDAEGDVLYSNGTNYVRLARGSDADVLTLASGVPSWATPTTGDITGITTGDGLSGGATSGTPTLAVDLVSNGGLEFSSGELRVATGISQYDVAQFAASVADNDFLRIDGTAVEGRSAAEVLSDIGAGAAAGSSSIVTVGALDAGSITDGFGTITAGGIIKTESTTAATTVDDGSIQTDGGLSVKLDAVIGDDLIMITDGAVLSQGIGADVKLTHDGTTGGTLSGTPIVIESLGASALADDAYTGIVLQFIAHENLVVGNAVYVHTDNGEVAKARANAVGTMPAIGIVVADANADNPVKVLTHGIINDANGWGGELTEGATMYVDDDTAGLVHGTIPDADGEFVQVMGMAVGPRDIFVNPSLDIIERD